MSRYGVTPAAASTTPASILLGESTTIRQRTAPFGRGGRPRIPLMPAIGVALGILASLVAGWAASGGHTLFAAPFLAAAAVVIFVRSPQLPFAAILLFASTFAVAYTLPKAGPLYPAEASLLLGLAALPLVRTAAFGGAIGTFLLIFLGAVGIGIVVAGGHGVGLHNTLLDARTPVLYASFWIALAAIRTNRRRFVLVVGITAVAVSLLSLAQFLLPGHMLFRSGGSSVVTSDNGFLRVRPPGLLLVYFGAIFALAYLFWGPKQRRLHVLLVGALFASAILISLNRNMLVGLTAGLVIALVVLPGRTGAAMRLVAVGIAAISIAGLSGGGAVIQRIVSLGNVSYLQRTTLADRQYEDAFARATIARHPISGIGWGVSYGANARTTSGVIQPRSFVHNQYYELWLRMGILGPLSYLLLLGAAGVAGLRLARGPRREDAWIGAGIMASIVALGASSIVGIYVLDAGSTRRDVHDAPPPAGLHSVS
jgi:O-antigen ligase